MDLQIEQLGVRLEDLSALVETYKNNLTIQDNSTKENISDILEEIRKLKAEDTALHNEINTLSDLDVGAFKDSTNVTINYLKSQIESYQYIYNRLQYMVNSNLSNQNESINLIADNVDTHESRLDVIDDDILDLEARCLNLSSRITTLFNVLNAEDTALHQEIHEVADEVDNHEVRITALEGGNTLLNRKHTQLENRLNSAVEDLNAEDEELHEEIHTLADKIDAFRNRVTQVEISNTNLKNQHNGFTSEINGLKQEDTELHEEIHTVADSLDKLKADINNYGMSGFNWKLITDEQYEKLDKPIKDVFYFTYEAVIEPDEPSDNPSGGNTGGGTYLNNILTLTGVQYSNNVLTLSGSFANNVLTITSSSGGSSSTASYSNNIVTTSGTTYSTNVMTIKGTYSNNILTI